jgi:hypothetical protein
MRRQYQLSKIGKEKRKSGSFRLCGPRDRIHDSTDVTPDQAGRAVPARIHGADISSLRGHRNASTKTAETRQKGHCRQLG